MKSINVNAVTVTIVNNLLDLFPGVALKFTCVSFNGKEYFAYSYDTNGRTYWFCYGTGYWRTLEAVFVEE